MGPDFKNMSSQHFYENYWLVNGEKPPPLTEFQKQLLQAYDYLKEGEKLVWLQGRQHGILAIQHCIQEKQSKQLSQPK